MERRGFFRSLAGEVAGFYDEIRGKPQLRLDEIGSLPDEVLAGIMPMIVPDVDIRVEEDMVLARLPGRCFCQKERSLSDLRFPFPWPRVGR